MSANHFCDGDEEQERDVAALRLREDLRVPGARHDLADALGTLVGRLVAKLEDATHDEGMPPMVPPEAKTFLASATATAAGAVEGTLKAKSLDGALKAAQIEQAYADAREKNAAAALRAAEAEKVRAETRKLEREAAISELTQVLQLIRTLGVPVGVALLPNGTMGITVGDGLSAEVQLLHGGAASATSAPADDSAPAVGSGL